MGEFLRTFSAFVPACEYPPYALTPAAIVNNCLSQFLGVLGKDFFETLPLSISKARECLKGIILFQRFVRDYISVKREGRINDSHYIQSRFSRRKEPMITEFTRRHLSKTSL